MLADDIRSLILVALFAYRNILLLRIIVSLLQSFAGFRPPDAIRPAFNFLHDVTEPFLRLFRRFLPAMGGLDLSPIIAFIVLDIITKVVARIIF